MLKIYFGELDSAEYGPFEIYIVNEDRVVTDPEDYFLTAAKYI